ncbi:MAG: nucleotide disphospho-sugar-binding domain-containing protein [Polyangiaceae bacterium]
MRVLLTCSPAYGHFHPMGPLARALAAAGHEVAFATAADFCERVERCGFRAFPAGLEMPERGEMMRRVIADMMKAPPADRPKLGFPRVFGEYGAPAMLPDLRDVLASYRPQLLIHDTSELAGPIAATAAGIPYVNHSFGHLLAADVIALAAEKVAPLWKQIGHDPPPQAGLFRHLYLDICPPSLQFPDISGVATRQALRPVPFDAEVDEQLPAWVDAMPAAPTVYVTMGTVFNEAQPLFRAILEGLRDEQVNIIVTLGKAGDPAALGPQPAHVHVERYVPQTLLFSRCHAIVSHGGSGTMLGALSAGLPLLSIPQGADQFRNAERCRTAGVGKALWPHELSAEAVRRDVRALLEEPRFRESAGRVRKEIEAMPGPGDVIGVLEHLVS